MDRLAYEESLEQERIDRACLRRQEATYVSGRADCIHFAAHVLDELSGKTVSKKLRSPKSLDSKSAFRVIKWFLQNYPLKRAGLPVRAGDILILRDSRDRLTHLMVVGDGRLWHANPPKVSFTGLVLPPETSLAAVYRLRGCSPSRPSPGTST